MNTELINPFAQQGGEFDKSRVLTVDVKRKVLKKLNVDEIHTHKDTEYQAPTFGNPVGTVWPGPMPFPTYGHNPTMRKCGPRLVG